MAVSQRPTLKKAFLSLYLISLFSVVVIYTRLAFSSSSISPRKMEADTLSHLIQKGNQLSGSVTDRENIQSNSTCRKDPIHVVILPSWMEAPEKGYETVENCDVPCMYTKDIRYS